MHQQIRGSPDSVAGNVARIVNVLAEAGVNIEGIAPDFEAPHVRVIVDHGDTEDPEAFEAALAAMSNAGLAPQIRPAVLVTMPNKPKALKVALDMLTRSGYAVESILVLPGGPEPDIAWVSFGVAQTIAPDWETDSSALATSINAELEGLS